MVVVKEKEVSITSPAGAQQVTHVAGLELILH